jgi:tetratricopeptide (TPR) repeat protein
MAGLGTRGKTVIFHPRNLVVLLAAALLFILRWKYNLTLPGFLLFFVLPLVVYFLVLPLVARKRFPAFERQVRILHMKGRWEQALAFYRRHLFMRAFGPVADMKRLLGQIHAFLFKWESARRAFSQSMAAGGPDPGIPVMAGYAEACFHTGEDREAAQALSSQALKKIRLPQNDYYAIHLLLEDEKKRGTARKIFEETAWDEEKDAAVRNLALAEILAEERKIDEALATLRKAGRDDLPRPLREMARLLEGRLLLLQKRKKEALAVLREIARSAPSGRHLIELEDFEDFLKEKGP